MKNIWKSILLAFMAVTFAGCSEDLNEDPDPNSNPDPEIPQTFDPISFQMDIGPYGGDLELSDESGNTVRLTILPGALTDTVGITLTLLGQTKDLPMETRELRTFRVEPENLNLYKPGLITIAYANSKPDIEAAGVFRVHDDQQVSPCLEHVYSGSEQTVTAGFLKGGEFAEGELSVEQATDQLGLLYSSLGFALKSSVVSETGKAVYTEDCSQFKEEWDDWRGDIGAILKLLEILFDKGYYNNHPAGKTLEDDIQELCDKVVSKAASDILNMPKPADPCCRDYKITIGSLLQSMMLLGCESPMYDQVEDRFNDFLEECKTYVVINSYLNVSSGGFTVETSGVVQVTIKDTEDGNATVEGSGSLEVSGNASAGGKCSATISGTTMVQVSGSRDAANFFNLDLNTNQIATMVTKCPDFEQETPLTGGGTQNVVLSPYNGYSITIEEPVDEGTFTMEVTLMNPYTDLP
jgi:hypothetical protein